MRAVVQRVRRAAVTVGDRVVGSIGPGLLVLVGVTHGDTASNAAALARKLEGLRILPGELSLADVDEPAVLLVSQFTLYADTRKGRRPSWSAAAPASVAEPIVAEVVTHLTDLGIQVATGQFGADMQVELVNDGPMTLLIDC